MEIKPLDENTIIVEACCMGLDRHLDKKSELTDQEQTALDAAKIKGKWLRKMIPKGLSAKIAYERDVAVGFIEYMPIELSNLHKGDDLYIVNCLIAPHTPPWEGVYRERIPGCGSSLIQAMMDDVKGKCKGIVTPVGFAYTEDMRGLFGKFGFDMFENEGLKMLIKRFQATKLPSPIRYQKNYQFQRVPGKVVIDIFWSSICPASPYTLLNMRYVDKKISDKIILNEICVDDREVLMKYGIKSGLYVNGKFPWSTYGPLEKEEIWEVLNRTMEGEGSKDFDY